MQIHWDDSDPSGLDRSMQQCVDAGVKHLSWRAPAEGVPRARAQLARPRIGLLLRYATAIRALRRAVPQRAVRILGRSALPETLEIAEVDLHACGHREALGLRSLLAPLSTSAIAADDSAAVCSAASAAVPSSSNPRRAGRSRSTLREAFTIPVLNA